MSGKVRFSNPKADRNVIDPVDVQVGERIRFRRKLMSMSQSALGEKLGITFQQIQKYENGSNRVSASKLQATANILGAPISYFFADDRSDPEGAGRENSNDADVVTQNAIAAFVCSADGLKLNQAFAQIENAKTRRSLIALIKVLGSSDD